MTITKQDADWVDRTFDGSNPNHGYMRTGAYEGIQYERERMQKDLDLALAAVEHYQQKCAELEKELKKAKINHEKHVEHLWRIADAANPCR